MIITKQMAEQGWYKNEGYGCNGILRDLANGVQAHIIPIIPKNYRASVSYTTWIKNPNSLARVSKGTFKSLENAVRKTNEAGFGDKEAKEWLG